MHLLHDLTLPVLLPTKTDNVGEIGSYRVPGTRHPRAHLHTNHVGRLRAISDAFHIARAREATGCHKQCIWYAVVAYVRGDKKEKKRGLFREPTA